MPGSSAQVGTPSAILRPQDLPPSPDPLVDLSALVVRMHTLLANPALGSAVPYPALELLARPQSERVYREKVVAPLRNGEIDAVSRAGTGSGGGPTSAHGPEKVAENRHRSLAGPDAVTSADIMISTDLLPARLPRADAEPGEGLHDDRGRGGPPLPRPTSQ